MNQLKVKLWGNEIGRLVWDSKSRQTYFSFNPTLKNEIPDIAPLISPAHRRNILLPIYGDSRPQYQGLPTFIADSLPDSWGNLLFEKWIKENKLPRSKVTPLYKLMFIGSRGMGALEYEPCASELSHTRSVNIKSLYDISLKILDDRNSIILDSDEALTLQALLAVGTSAGGRQMKAIVAINETTGEIRSGQTDCPDGFEYFILKFGDNSFPSAEIEAAYYNMAIASGIRMEKCRLMPVDGTNHFITKRFDRIAGNKVHVQTLAAINPEANSYEDLVATCREISLPESEIEQLFTRLVFNVMANNTDDHNKNFSFSLEQNGNWHLSPAYDMTFIFNRYGTGANAERRLSIGGKTADISKSDLLDFARANNISYAHAIIDSVADAISNFKKFAEPFSITQPWLGIIDKTLTDRLAEFGYANRLQNSNEQLRDKFHRTIENFSIEVNQKKHFVVTATIDGHRQRRFVRPNSPIYSELSKENIFDLGRDTKIRLVQELFEPE